MRITQDAPRRRCRSNSRGPRKRYNQGLTPKEFHPMQSRRNFIGHVATGLAGTLAASNVLGANDRIRIGIIGPGTRGTEILQTALTCPNVECIGATDVYTRRLEDVKQIAPN